MSQFILVIHTPPWSYSSVKSACQFAEAAITRGNQVKAIFFYQDGVLNAATSLDIPSDELNGQKQILNLVKNHNIPLLLCVTAAEKRGLKEDVILPPFTISGLAEFAELSTQADQIIQFK